MKTCSKCRTEKELSEFCTDNRTPDKKKRWCKSCCAASIVKWKEANPEKAKEAGRSWHRENKHRVKAYDAKRYLANRERSLAYGRKWRKENPEKHAAYKREYAATHKERLREYAKHFKAKSFRNRLHATVSRSISASLGSGKKGRTSWTEFLGYDIETLMAHLEKTMPQGCTWKDYGRTGLHIDHIIPLSAFNFDTPRDIDFKRCWALKNLRLLPARENMRKAAKLDRPFQPALAMGG